MNLTEAKQLANQLMHQHGIIQQGWRLCIDMKAKRRLGQCRYSRKEIGLSYHYVILNGEGLVRDTILHEIAHALTPGSGHGYAWKRKCVEIGAKPERCFKSVETGLETVAPKYIASCTNCNKNHFRHKMTRRSQDSACGKCCNGRYNSAYKLTFKLNLQNLTK